MCSLTGLHRSEGPSGSGARSRRPATPEGAPMRRPVGTAALAVAIAALLSVAVLVVPSLVRHEEDQSGEASLREFARERAGINARRLPIAVMREKLEKGKEAGGEAVSGPAQQQVDQRAYPRAYVETKRALAARRSFRAAPSR